MRIDAEKTINRALTIANICAIIFGGYWTYARFIQERHHVPRAAIENIISSEYIDHKLRILRVTVIISNKGDSKIDAKNFLVRIHQINPIDCTTGRKCVSDEISKALNEKNRDANLFAWPLVSERKFSTDTPLQIEPGETEELNFEFAIKPEIKSIRVYSHIQNESNTIAQMGWHQSNYYDFQPKQQSGEKP